MKHKSEESENAYENEKDCPKLDTDAIKVEVIKAEGTKVNYIYTFNNNSNSQF